MKLFPVNAVHTAGFDQLFVHREGGPQNLGLVLKRRHFQIAVQLIAESGVRAVVNDGARVFFRAFPPEVGDALLGDDHLNGMFAVVFVADHRNNGADLVAFGRRRTGENREIRIPRKIAAAADAVHHFSSQNMRGVDVASDIDFESRVNRDDAESTDDFWVVGNFLRP